jgi:autotransporter translocation and assembly factor TamB
VIRKLFKIAGYAGLALVLLALLAYLARDPLRDAIVQTVSAQVSKTLHGSLEIGKLRGSLLTSLVLQDIVLRDQHGVVAQLAEVRLWYDLLTLLKGQITVYRADLVRPQVTLVQGSDGVWNIARLFPPSAPQVTPPPEPPTSLGGFPFTVVLARLQILDGQVDLQTPSLPGVQRLEALQMRLQGFVDRSGLRIKLQRLTVRATPADVEIRTLHGALQGLPGDLRIDDLRLETAQSLITVDGVLPGGKRSASLELHMQPFNLAEVGRLLQDDTLQGPLRLALKAAGPPEALGVLAELRAAGGQVDLQGHVNTLATPPRYQGTLDIAQLNLAALLGRAGLQSDLNMRLELDGAGLPPGNLRGKGHLEILPSHFGSITLRASQIQVEAEPRRFEVRHFDLDTSVARMTVTGAIDLTGQSDLQYQLTADLAHLRQLLGTEALDGEVRVHGQVGGALTAITSRGTVQASHLRYQDNRLENLQLTYEGSDLGAHPQVSARLVARQAQTGTLPVEQVEIHTTYQETAPQIRFAAEVHQSAGHGGKTAGSVSFLNTGQHIALDTMQIQLADRIWRAEAPLEASLTPAGVHLKRFRLIHANEILEASGALHGQQLQDIQLHAQEIDLTALRRLFGLPELLQGKATLQVQLTGTLEQPVLHSELAFQPELPARLARQHWHTSLTYEHEQLRTEARLQQGDREVLTVQLGLPIDLALSPVPLEQRLRDAPIALRIEVKRPDLAALPHWFPALAGVSGTLQGGLTAQGTYAALDLNANLQLQHLGLRGMVADVSAPLRLNATLHTAASVPELVRAWPQGGLTPSLQKLALRVPTLRAQLSPGQGTAPPPLQIQDLQMQADARLSDAGLQATLHVLRLQARAFGLPQANLAMSARMTSENLELTRFQVRLPQSEVRGRGTLNQQTQQLRFRFDLTRLRLDELVQTLPSAWPSQVQGVLEVRGSVQAPRLEARLQYAGADITANLATQLQEPLPQYNATLRVTDLQVAPWLPGAQGRLQTLLRLQGRGLAGTQRRASLEVQVEAQDFSLAPGLTTVLRANLDGEAVQLEQLRLQSLPLELQASGALSATRQLALTYALSLGDLQALQKYLGLELQATGGITGEVQGTLPAVQTHGAVKLDTWGMAGFRGKALHAEFSAANLPAGPQATLQAQLAELQGPSLPASAMRLDGNFHSQQGKFSLAMTAGPYEQTMLAGQVDLQDGLHVTLDRLRMQHQQLAWENAQPIELVRNRQGELHVSPLLLRSGDQEIKAQGTLRADGAVQANIQVQRLQILPTVRVFTPDLVIPDGHLALDLACRGTLQRPQITGTLGITSLQWQKQDLGTIQARFEVDGGTVRPDVRWQDQAHDLLRVYGTLGTGPGDALDLRVQAPEFDMARLARFSPEVLHSAGVLNLDLHLTGTRQRPLAQGVLALRDGSLQLRAAGERYRDMQIRLAFAGERVEIERLHVGSRSGTLQLTGWIETADLTLRQLDVSLQADNFTAVHTSDIEAIVSAAVTARGSLHELTATGNITVPHARVRLAGILGGGPADVQPWELTVAGVYGPGPEAVGSPNGGASTLHRQVPLPFLRTDLTVDIPKNAWVQGPGMAIELSGKIRVTKALQEPFILAGNVETVRGFATFYGKKFTVQEGKVTFPGTEEINPFLDVTVTHKVSDYVVTIGVGGKATQPKLSLSSEPELPEADVVSLLVLGKTTDRLTASEQNTLADQAQRIAGGIAAKQIQDTIGKPLGLDTVEIQAGNKLGEGRVGVGRYVTQDIFLSYERELGGESENKVGVEYSLNRRLKLKGSSSDLGNTAVDIFWHLDY